MPRTDCLEAHSHVVPITVRVTACSLWHVRGDLPPSPPWIVCKRMQVPPVYAPYTAQSLTSTGERERQTDRETDRQTDSKRDRELRIQWIRMTWAPTHAKTIAITLGCYPHFHYEP